MPDDDKLFRGRVEALTKATIGFSSDGGSLLAGIAIGKVIRLKSFATLVMSGKRCASACALAWLGGNPQYMGSNAYIGFHAAYVEKEGRATETGVGNALLGSYLTQIGLPERAVVYITVRAPNEMNWLSMHDAEQNGIDVKLLQGAPAVVSEAPALSPGQPEAIFPKGIASSYASETSGKARMLTCRDQYVANKANGGNGGMLWIQQDGGYYTACNEHLKAMGYWSITGVLDAEYMSYGNGNGAITVKMPDDELLKGEYSIVRGAGRLDLEISTQAFMGLAALQRDGKQHELCDARRQSGASPRCSVIGHVEVMHLAWGPSSDAAFAKKANTIYPLEDRVTEFVVGMATPFIKSTGYCYSATLPCTSSDPMMEGP